jgi:hypothetical protein
MTCQAQLRALSPTNEKPQSSIAAKGREEAGRSSEQVRCLLGAAIDGGSRMREKEGKDLAARITLNLSFSKRRCERGCLSSGGLSGARTETKFQRATGRGRARGWTCKGFQGNRTWAWREDGESGFRGLGTVEHCLAVSPRCNLTNQPEPALCLPLVGRQQKRPLPVFGPSFECRVVRLRRSISR